MARAYRLAGEFHGHPTVTGEHDDGDLVERARAGDPGAFEALLAANRPRLRSVIRRLVGHPDDTDDLVQETTIRAWEAIASYRGEAAFSTWLCAIGVRRALDHLRGQRRWRAEAQIAYANECAGSPALQGEVMAVLADPAFVYEVGEHIAYCFTCVGRSLAPEEQAALVLREVLGLSNREAARALEVSESVLRHRLGAARRGMQARFEGLCSLVNKRGVCYQCKGLRNATPGAQRGPPVPSLPDLDSRLQVVRSAAADGGASQALHDLFWRRTRTLEETGAGNATPDADCGRD